MKLERYVTIGVQENIPAEIQFLLWSLQTSQRSYNENLDYLQVYDLQIENIDDKEMQKIIHSAEEDEYEKAYITEMNDMVEAKIFIIEDKYEDKIVETMLLAEEY